VKGKIYTKVIKENSVSRHTRKRVCYCNVIHTLIRKKFYWKLEKYTWIHTICKIIEGKSILNSTYDDQTIQPTRNLKKKKKTHQIINFKRRGVGSFSRLSNIVPKTWCTAKKPLCCSTNVSQIFIILQNFRNYKCYNLQR